MVRHYPRTMKCLRVFGSYAMPYALYSLPFSIYFADTRHDHGHVIYLPSFYISGGEENCQLGNRTWGVCVIVVWERVWGKGGVHTGGIWKRGGSGAEA